ncbi:hypothetical protein CN918_25675 [Priestia megaterium]|nr:hypothetical protein CN918_25675 [Priestia megaterium]
MLSWYWGAFFFCVFSCFFKVLNYHTEKGGVSMIIHLPTLRDSVYRPAVLSLLKLCDEDFIPSLSSSRHKGTKNASLEEKLNHYLQEKEPFHHYLLAFNKHRVIGMLNFVPTSHQIEVDTICVHPHFRNQQVGYAFYAYLMGEICLAFSLTDIVVPCNDTAAAHAHLLQKLHFTPLEDPTSMPLFHKKIRF